MKKTFLSGNLGSISMVIIMSMVAAIYIFMKANAQ
jgi:hypothetical protein